MLTRWASMTSHIYKLFVMIIAVIVSCSCISTPKLKGTADCQNRSRKENFGVVSLVKDSQGKVLTNNKPFSQNQSNMDIAPSSSETRERHNKQVENHEEEVKGEKLKTKLAFTAFGFVSNAMGSLIYTAAQDILLGRSLPTAVVLLTFVVPQVLCSVVGSFCLVKLSPSKRTALIFANHSCGTLLLALAPQVEFKLIGVGLVSAGNACGHVGIMPLTAYYHHTTVIYYTTGTGLGYLFAPLYYSGK